MGFPNAVVLIGRRSAFKRLLSVQCMLHTWHHFYHNPIIFTFTSRPSRLEYFSIPRHPRPTPSPICPSSICPSPLRPPPCRCCRSTPRAPRSPLRTRVCSHAPSCRRAASPAPRRGLRATQTALTTSRHVCPPYAPCAARACAARPPPAPHPHGRRRHLLRRLRRTLRCRMWRPPYLPTLRSRHRRGRAGPCASCCSSRTQAVATARRRKPCRLRSSSCIRGKLIA